MSRARVLIVDDERFFREAITDILAGEALDVITAETGEEAIAAAEDERVGVVILDLQLPDIHGLDVFRRIREDRPELRVIILSAHTDQENVLEALRLGAFDYLAKPIHEEELALAVRRAMETYDLAHGWTGLRQRLTRLEETLEELWARARTEDGGTDQELKEAAVQAASEILGAARTSLLLLDEDQNELRVAAARGAKQATEEMDAVPVGQGVAGMALARFEPILVNDVREDARFRDRNAPGSYASHSFAVAPLAAGARALGVLCATDRSGGSAFDEEDLALLRILSVQIAQMLDARRLDAESVADAARQSGALLGGEPTRETELVRAVCEAVTAEVEPARILEAALKPVAEALDAAPVSLYLLDARGERLVREAENDGARRSDRPALEVGRGLTGSVLETGQLVASQAPGQDPRFDATVDTPEDGETTALLCGPLRFRGKCLGVFRAFPGRPEAAAPGLGEVLSAALSAAVRNVLLYRSLVETIEEVADARREGARGPSVVRR